MAEQEWVSSTKLHTERRKARKEHSCQWCKWPILAGEVYISECWIVDGDFTYERHHLNYLGECMPKAQQPQQDEQPYYETKWAPSYR